MSSKFYDLTVIKGDQQVAKLGTDLDLEHVDVSAARLRKVLAEAAKRDRGERELWRYLLEVRERDRPQVLFVFVDSTLDAP